MDAQTPNLAASSDPVPTGIPPAEADEGSGRPPHGVGGPAPDAGGGSPARDIADVPAIEVITTAAVHLMSAAAVKCGLAPDEPDGARGADLADLDEARRLITALAGLVTASAPDLGSQHAAALRDGLKSLQLAFREASAVPDPPGQGPGERLTGSVV